MKVVTPFSAAGVRIESGVPWFSHMSAKSYVISGKSPNLSDLYFSVYIVRQLISVLPTTAEAMPLNVLLTLLKQCTAQE